MRNVVFIDEFLKNWLLLNF